MNDRRSALRCWLLPATLRQVGVGFSRRRLSRSALVSVLTLLLAGCARFGFELSLLEPGAAPDRPSCAACDAGAAGAAGAGGSAGATCSDGVLDGDETATDCGGSCGKCDPSASETCSDGLLNQDETAIDCGGRCAACDTGPPATCSDGAQNQGETAADCGGPCAACDAGPTASCSDGVINQDETGVDCGGACRACVPTSCTQVVADSAAEFSNVQGQAGWRYGYYVEPDFTSAAFIEMVDYRFEQSVGDEGWFTADTWTWIGRTRMHPNGRVTSGGRPAIDQQAVRRWTSTVSETLFVQGTLRSTNSASSGIVGRILVNDTEVWQRVVAAGDNQPHAVQVLVTVGVGDAVNVTIDPYQSNDAADDTEFSVKLCR